VSGDAETAVDREQERRRRSARWRRAIRRVVVTGLVLVVGGGVMFAALWKLFPLPEDMLHPGPGGALVLDADGGVLVDVVAADEQRRLPVPLAEVGPWIPAAIVAVEDASFRSHAGIDPSAILAAIKANLAAGRVVRGGSTITMQVAGMRLGHPRTFPGKAVEAFRALQLEAAFDKDEILEAWLNLAPFGGNLVGIEAASRGWFGKPASACTLAEAALLAGLPNAPERFRPDRHPDAAMRRRHVVLDRMLAEGLIDETQHARADAEPVMIRTRDGIGNDRHVGWMAIDAAGRGRVIETTIDPIRQEIIESIVADHALGLPTEVDVAVVLVETETGAIRGLVGSSDPRDPRDGRVNGATTRRSPGSALKPFLYAAAFEDERLGPDSIVDDAPADFAGWRPRNVDRRHLGRMPASEALRTSRNLPALLVARGLGPDRIEAALHDVGLPITSADLERAGLAIAVGGVEVRPIDLAEAYATLARGGVHRPLRLLRDDDESAEHPDDADRPGRRVLSERTCAAIETCLAGPAGDDAEVLPFMAAKTGTSSAHRDAVAAGWNRRWTAVVWVGRFDGASDPALLGADAARPILHDVLHHPSLATPRTPRPFASWTVAEDRAVGRLGPSRIPEIVEPADGTVLLAVDGSATVRPTVQRGPRAKLFLDGRPVAFETLELAPGRHEIRVVEPGRDPHAVTVEVVRR
jgi:penicillin-binding protein 1C